MDKYVVDDLLSSTSCDASCDRSSWLDINGLFFDISKNRQKNFTEAYNWQNNKTLVVRRGFSFTLQLTANRLFNSTNHAIIFVFDSGAGRSVADSVQQIQLQSNCNNFDDNTSADWTAELIETDHNVITVEINIPVKCIIGCWTLRIFSGFFEEPDQLTDIHECSVSKFQKSEVYVLFNPFLQADPAFYGNACERKFYLSQTTEMCFTGTKVGSNGYNFTKTPWIHDQFDENTLKTAIFLLSKVARPDNATLTDDRQNIVRVIRKLAYAVKHLFFALGNEPDQSGYISTKQLILKFLNSQQSLPSNESLVQANLYVSLVRSLGICARIVTCIEACYDADPNLTVDRAFVRNSSDFVFEPMKNSAGQLWDCTRTQQFWVECYCSRTDLGVGYDGWQLLDPTAPDSPLTERQAGPAALKSLQNSKLDLPYDARFFCGIYRSNKVLWFYEYDHEIDEYRLLHVRCCKKNGISARAIITADPRCPLYPMDITDSYYSKSTKLQDREQTKALKTAGALERFHKIRLLYGSNVLQNPVDVEVNVTPIDEVIIGDNVIVEIGFKNNTQVFRTVKVSVRVHNRHKNGKIGVQVNSYKEVYELDSGEEESLRLLTPVAEYIRASNNDSHDYVAVISGMVEETGQIIFHEEDFHLTTSVIGIVAPAIATYGDNVVALIAIVNPLPEPLKQCRLELVAGHDADKKIVVERMPSEIAAGQRVKLPIRVRLSGMCLRVLVAKLYCQPLGYATAVHVLEVKDE